MTSGSAIYCELASEVPAETPNRDRVINEELKKKGQTLFSKDGVHPAKPGHELYLESVVAAFKAMQPIPPVDHAMFVGKPFFDGKLAAEPTPRPPTGCVCASHRRPYPAATVRATSTSWSVSARHIPNTSR